MYPPFTNHFSPYSALFKPEQRMFVPAGLAIVNSPYTSGQGIIMSDIGISAMIGVLVYLGNLWGWKTIVAYYFIPYVLCNHWIGEIFFH